MVLWPGVTGTPAAGAPGEALCAGVLLDPDAALFAWFGNAMMHFC
jgi:hypothetical protein